jgi:hypothetical protein
MKSNRIIAWSALALVSLAAGACAGEIVDDGQDSSPTVDSTELAQIRGASCTDDEFNTLVAAHESVVVSLLRADQAYRANPSSPEALASFGNASPEQVERVKKAFHSLLLMLSYEAFGWQPEMVCAPRIDCYGAEEKIVKEAFAFTPDTGPFVGICSRKHDVDVALNGGPKKPEWSNFPPPGIPTFWMDPYHILIHEYWHWLKLPDVQKLSPTGPDEAGYVEPDFLQKLAQQWPEGASQNPESLATFARHFR